MGRMSRPHSRTGRARWWVTFQVPVTTFSGADNTPVTAWVNVYETWAEIVQQGGGEDVWPNQVQASEELLLRCRWFDQAKQSGRITIENMIFNIIQVNDIGSLHQELAVTAAELDPQE